jgi:hypothetical protein
VTEPIEAVLREAFPEWPLPKAFFAATKGLEHDIAQELSARIRGRAWTALSLLDWRFVGAGPTVCREYIIPATFAYYVPSFLVGAISEPAFRDWAFEAVLPSNQQRKPKGEWWSEYIEAFSDQQRIAIKSFLVYHRRVKPLIDPVEEELLSTAEVLWR